MMTVTLSRKEAYFLRNGLAHWEKIARDHIAKLPAEKVAEFKLEYDLSEIRSLMSRLQYSND